MIKSLIALLLFIMCVQTLDAHNEFERIDSVRVIVNVDKDSVNIAVACLHPKYQMSFLMQGFQMTLIDSLTNDSIVIKYPNAMMVRNKIKRHPNEVKATIKRDGSERRPDLQPLISALNDTISTVQYNNDSIIASHHKIILNRESETLEFSINIPHHFRLCNQKTITLIVECTQSGLFDSPEFIGKRLSKENKMPPGGLGQISNIQNDSNRNFKIVKTIKIQ